MDWVAQAEEFCSSYGWGARGKYIGVSRMFSDGDKITLQRHKMVMSIRPRGILSGFLAVVPALGYAVYLPPVAARTGPQRIRMRLSDTVLKQGAIFSAYLMHGGKLILEDVLAWKGNSVWFTTSFEERWNSIMKQFVLQEWKNDPVLQTRSIDLASYVSISDVSEPDAQSVLEFVPNAPNQKRLIWIPSREIPANTILNDTTTLLTAKQEASMGPDVYSIWRGEERLGLALVRTLAISRALRGAKQESIPVDCVWNKQFEKWEIQTISSAKV
jgi:hypothetical protein